MQIEIIIAAITSLVSLFASIYKFIAAHKTNDLRVKIDKITITKLDGEIMELSSKNEKDLESLRKTLDALLLDSKNGAKEIKDEK